MASLREVVVGWFPTGDEISQTPAVIHNMHFTKESQFTATAVLSRPPHLVVDNSLTQESLSMKASASGAAGAVPRGAPHCVWKQARVRSLASRS